MKKLLITSLIAVFMLSNIFAQYDDELSGYEGDFFSLEGALELFKNSNTVRQFERRLNKQDNWVNNLDLDYDGQTDYIRVEHRRSGNFHAIIMQIPLSRYEIQDVAVIEIEKVGPYDAVLQIIGDADLYGEEVIVESYDNNYVANYGRNYCNVYNWTPVRYIFAPTYQVYVSPYSWSYRPNWWNPWRPCSWQVFRPRIITYRSYCRVVTINRVRNVHNFYRPYRSYSRDVTYRATQVRTKRATSTRQVVNSRNNTTRYKDRSQVRPGNTKSSAYNSNRGTAQTRPNTTRPNTSRPNVSTRPSSGKGTSPSKVSRPNRGTGHTRPSTTRSNTSRPNVSKRPSRGNVSKPSKATKPNRGTSTRSSTSRSQTSRPNVSTRPSRGNVSKPSKVTKPNRGTSTRQSTSRSRTQTKPSKARTSTSTRAQSPKRNTSQARPSGSRSKTSTRPSPSRSRTSTKATKPSSRSSQARSSSSSKNKRPAQTRSSSSRSSSKSKSSSRGNRN